METASTNAHLTGIFIYPVKSLGGIELTECAVEERGLRHDRRWMLVDRNGMFLTQRKLPHLACVRVGIEEDGLRCDARGMPPLSIRFEPPPAGPVQVQVWRSGCAALPVGPEADAWFTAVAGQPCRLVFMPEGTRRSVDPKHAGPDDIVSFADGYPILVISEASLAELNSRLPDPLPMDRFRPNLVVRGIPAHAEDAWGRAHFPGAILQGAKPCGRCTVTTVDQASGEPRGPEPLRTLARYRRDAGGEVLFGQNLLVARTGMVCVGDEIRLRGLEGR